MELDLNPTAQKVLQSGLEACQLPQPRLQKLMQKLRRENNLEDMGNLIVGGYLVSLIGACQRANCDFGLTYSTVKTLPVALAALYREQKEYMPSSRNLHTLGATISVYLMLLCTNEHQCPLNYRLPFSPLMNPKEVEKLFAQSFSGICVSTGTKAQVDFYEAGQQCVSGCPSPVKKVVVLSMQPAIRAYRKATGIDLAEYGMTDIVIEA